MTILLNAEESKQLRELTKKFKDEGKQFTIVVNPGDAELAEELAKNIAKELKNINQRGC